MANKTGKTAPTPKTFLGISTPDVLKIILGGVLCSVPAGLIVYYVTSRSPHLYVQVMDTMPFEGEQNRLGIVDFKVTNDGDKKAEQVECTFALNGCPIRELTVRPESLHPTSEHKDDKATIKVPRLNAGQFIEVRAVAGNPEKLPKTPDIIVNADDVVGAKEPRGAGLSSTAQTVIFYIIFYALMIAAMWIFTNIMTRRMSVVTDKVSGNIRRVGKLIEKSESHVKGVGELIHKSDVHLTECTAAVDKAMRVIETEPIASALEKAGSADPAPNESRPLSPIDRDTMRGA